MLIEVPAFIVNISSDAPSRSTRQRMLPLKAAPPISAPFVVTETRVLARRQHRALTCATAQSVLDSSDFTYLGAIRMAAGVDTTFACGSEQNGQWPPSPASLWQHRGHSEGPGV